VTPETVSCPSCGAVLITDEEPNLPGVTAVDAKVMRGEKPPQRSRFLSWISGEYPEETPTETDAQAIAPPDREVQREIRRLTYEAEVANLQAEVVARQAEAVVEGRVVEVPEGIRPLETNEPGASASEGGEGDAPIADAESSAADAPTADDEPAAGEAPAADDDPAADDTSA
jgi:hypothetical protein